MGARAIMATLICAAPLTAAAATLPIDGIYGNPPGCTLAKPNNYGEDDSAMILRPEGLATMVSDCGFTEVISTPAGLFRVAMTCASEGSGPEDNHHDRAEISGNADSGYVVHFADGSKWGPLTRC